MDLLTALKNIPEFKGLAESHLQWLVEKGTTKNHADGDRVFKPGDVVDELRIVLKGEVNIYITQAGNRRHMGTIETSEITGLLPYSRMKAASAEGIVSGDALVYYLHKDHFTEMIHDHHELTSVFVHVMTDRVREFTKEQQQNDKMMALGKLSAGLAHELNNPSAAVVRSAHELKKHLGNLPEKFKSVIKIQTSEPIVDEVNQLVFSKIAERSKKVLSLSQRTQHEDEIIEWLENNEIDNGYEMAETFGEFQIAPEDLDHLKNILRPQDLVAVINWVSQVLMTEQLVNEIEEASRRINTLVTSIKSYTHMDRATEKEPSDIRDGIHNTLTMLNHKIKKGQITVVENIPDNLPTPKMFVSSMNQVWTNLIDNAVDALEGRADSKIEINAENDNNFLMVDVIDNGPGIPADIQDKIFDSFFTTKPVGKGTGLGLEVVRQIVNQHNGRVYVKSEPGRTQFSVCIPLTQ